MSGPLIPGGCILLARKIIESEIWEKPPLYLKVWVYLLLKAQHRDYKNLKRGQLITSFPEIMDGVAWKVGAARIKPSKDQIFQIIDWFRKASSKATLPGFESNAKATPEAMMITTTKATQRILINISNYGDYQDFKSYESNDQSNDQSNDEKATGKPGSAITPNNINKNVSTNKNEQHTKTSSRQRKTYAEDSSAFKMAVYLHGKIMKYADGLGKEHLVRDADMQKWANDCRKILELDKRERAEVWQVIKWTAADPFWQGVILSPTNLRKHYQDLCLKAAAAEKTGKRGNSPSETLAEKNRAEKQKIQEMLANGRGRDKAIVLDNPEHV